MRLTRSYLATRTPLTVAMATLVGVAILVFFAIPRTNDKPAPFRQTFTSSSAVNVKLTLDSIDPTTGSMELRLHAQPGARLPPDGAVLFTSIDSIPAVRVASTGVNGEQTATVLFQQGDVSDYPFEDYGTTIQLVAFRGMDPTYPVDSTRPQVSLNVLFYSDLANFTPTVQGEVQKDGIPIIIVQLRRSLGTRIWVLIMMAVYWVMALGAAAVTVMVVTRRRQWETGLFLWLGALIFALFAFRTAAPGNPPVGTFLDFFAVFEAVGIVAISLVVLIVYYLVQPSERLNLPPPA